MLAGFLVASTAAAMMAVYFLMGHYMMYMTQTAHAVNLGQQLEIAEMEQVMSFEQAMSQDWEATEIMRTAAILP